MSKLCCFPMSDTPTLRVNFSCPIACCESRLGASMRNTDTVDGNQEVAVDKKMTKTRRSCFSSCKREKRRETVDDG